MGSSRTYADESYGAHQTVSSGVIDVALTTNASAASVWSMEFLYPAKVISWNVANLTAIAEDLGTSTSWTLAHIYAGTATAIGTVGIADDLATSTFAVDYVWDGTITETTIAAGDGIAFQVEGTVGSLVNKIAVCVEVKEDFVQSDS